MREQPIFKPCPFCGAPVDIVMKADEVLKGLYGWVTMFECGKAVAYTVSMWQNLIMGDVQATVDKQWQKWKDFGDERGRLAHITTPEVLE